MLRLRNPHSVLAALQKRPRDVTEVFADSRGGDAWDPVVQLAKKHGIKISAPKRGEKSEDGRVGVAEATVREREGLPVEELFKNASSRAQGKGLWLALDCLQDPHNVGAIFRTAAFFGVQGVLLTQERSAPLTHTVYDIACGGLEHVPFTLQTNLQRGFEAAKEAGLWILGTSEHAHDEIGSIGRPWLLVIGNEEKGMRRLTEESCDVLCKINPRGGVTSLNASVAASIFISTLSG
jgi:23S rRNA (guanosine2251-2'-O)-methyltransferase